MKFSRPVDQQGFVTIPKVLRDIIGAEIGDTIEVEVSNQDKNLYEIRKIHRTGRIYLHKDVRKELGVAEGGMVTLDIKNIVEKKSEEKKKRNIPSP